MKRKLVDALCNVRTIENELNTALDGYCESCDCVPDIEKRRANTDRVRAEHQRVLADGRSSMDARSHAEKTLHGIGPPKGDEDSLQRVKVSIENWAERVCEIETKLYFAKAEVDGLSREIIAEEKEKTDD